MPKSEKKEIGNIFPGQGWVKLNGNFTYHELRNIAMQIEKEYMKVNGRKK